MSRFLAAIVAALLPVAAGAQSPNKPNIRGASAGWARAVAIFDELLLERFQRDAATRLSAVRFG